MNRSTSQYRPKVRPRFQREFFRWLLECRGEFATPLRLMRRTDKTIRIVFPELSPNINSYILVNVRPTELSISVTIDGEFVDYLLDIDLALAHSSQGYFCRYCDLEPLAYFASREAAWRSHQFEPFLAWINTQLAPARWLRLFFTSEGSSSASLICDEADLERTYPGISLLTGLKRLEGQPMFRFGVDELEIWDIPMRGIEKEVHFHAVIDAE